MLDRRWVKVIHDLWLFKFRTINVIAAIALGVIGIGIVSTTQIILLDNYVSQYWASQPAHARVSLTSFGENLLRRVRKLPEVVTADARHVMSTLAQVEPGKSLTFQLQAIPDFNAITVDKLVYLPGAVVPPPKSGVLLERSAQHLININVGDTLEVRMPDGKHHLLTVSGFVLDSSQVPTHISSQLYGYITFETSTWLEHDEKGVFDPVQDQAYDRLLIVTDADPLDKIDIENKVYQLKKDLGRLVPNPPFGLSYTIPTPGKPTLQDNLNSMWIVLQVAGLASLGLSGFLVVNVMTALISQQVKQIGILKAIGGRRVQISFMYLIMAMVLGGIAFVIAVPVGLLGAWGVSQFIAGILNTDLNKFYLPWNAAALQATTSLLVPAIATIVPSWAGTRMTAREAMMSNSGSASNSGLLARLLSSLPVIPLQITLAARNVFRHRLRLGLTLVALSIGGSTFIATIGTNNGLSVTFEEIKAENYYDILIRYELASDILPKDVEKTILAIPGVSRVETWYTASMRRVLDDGSLSGSIPTIAVDPTTPMLRQKPVQGHWLAPDGQNTLYVNYDALEILGRDALDKPIKIEMNGSKTMWQVVGVAGRTLNPTSYIRIDDFDRYFKTRPVQHTVVIQTTQRDRGFVEDVEAQIMQRFKDKKWQVNSSSTLSRNLGSAWTQMMNVVYVLLGTAGLVGAVGGLGLANTLELNVMEHTREIGVLRSLGAKSRVIRVMVTTESFTIGALSIVIATLLTQPLGTLLCDLVGATLFARQMSFEFPLVGLLLWFALIGSLSLIASLAPAQAAINLTVRDTLAYE